MGTWEAVCGIFSGFEPFGRLREGPVEIKGVTTMKMMRSTRQTSTSGVTLISLRIELRESLCMRPSPGTEDEPPLKEGKPDFSESSLDHTP
jgi:hypothetical protein